MGRTAAPMPVLCAGGAGTDGATACGASAGTGSSPDEAATPGRKAPAGSGRVSTGPATIAATAARRLWSTGRLTGVPTPAIG
eukprot:6046384-Prorocentrum_lima.AAC.1